MMIDSELYLLDMNDCYIVDEDLFAAILNGCLIDMTKSTLAYEKDIREMELRRLQKRQLIEKLRLERETEMLKTRRISDSLHEEEYYDALDEESEEEASQTQTGGA